MPNAHLYLSPAATGKTTDAVERTRETAQSLQTFVRARAPSDLRQARAWRKSLAEAGAPSA
jgi:hypothetical protein